jgi:hypothetical protein
MSTETPSPTPCPSRVLTIRPLPPVDLVRRHAAAAAIKSWLAQTDDYDERVGEALDRNADSTTMRCADDHAGA